jgi:SHS2 domain-containing protein
MDNTTSGQRFEEIEHTADAAIRVWGEDYATLFANAAYGLASLLAAPASVTPSAERVIEVDGIDLETLLVAWLSELLYLDERDGLVFVAFEFETLTKTELRCRVHGGSPSERRQSIKAVTFSELAIESVSQMPGGEPGYQTKIVFDV